MIDSLLFRGVAGFLVNTTSCNNNYLIGVASRGIPIVLCDRYINHYNFNIVTFEQDAPFFNLVRHLKEEGYTRASTIHTMLGKQFQPETEKRRDTVRYTAGLWI